MAKISTLQIAEQLTGDEYLPIVQGLSTKRTTMAAFRTLITPFLQNWYKGDKGDTGASDNTYYDLAAFRASSVTRGAASLVGVAGVPSGRFYWTLGDFSGQDDGRDVIAANATPLNIGAWVREYSGGYVDIFKYVPRHLQSAITKRVIDNRRSYAEALTSYIQSAIDEASGRRATLRIRAGIYNLCPIFDMKAEAGSIVRCFKLRSNLTIEAELGATFRIIDGVSTDQNPVFMAMFGNDERLQNIHVFGLDCDMNGPANLFSPNRNNTSLPHRGYNLYNQAAIYVSGTTADRAALIDNMTIDTCRFRQCYGVSAVVAGQSNKTDSGLGSGWVVRNCEFLDGGFDTVDHSALYMWAKDSSVTHCLFENSVPFGQNGGLVACEIHGPRTTFSNNRVKRFFQGLWIDGNSSEITHSVQVINNDFEEIGAFGILFFGQSANAAPVIGTLLQSNNISLDDTAYPGIDLKYGFGTFGEYSQVDVRAFDNHVTGIGRKTAKAGAVVSAGSIAGQKHDLWKIRGNTFEAVSIGAAFYTNGAVGLGTMDLTDNTAKNLVRAGGFLFPQAWAVMSGGALIDDLVIVDNACIDDRLVEGQAGPSETAFSTRLQGPVNRLTMSGNRARGVTNDHTEVAFSALKRVGRYVATFPYDPPPLAAGASASVDFNVPNAVFGDPVTATINVPTEGVIISAAVQAAGIVRVTMINLRNVAVDLTSGTVTIMHERLN